MIWVTVGLVKDLLTAVIRLLARGWSGVWNPQGVQACGKTGCSLTTSLIWKCVQSALHRSTAKNNCNTNMSWFDWTTHQQSIMSITMGTRSPDAKQLRQTHLAMGGCAPAISEGDPCTWEEELCRGRDPLMGEWCLNQEVVQMIWNTYGASGDGSVLCDTKNSLWQTLQRIFSRHSCQVNPAHYQPECTCWSSWTAVCDITNRSNWDSGFGPWGLMQCIGLSAGGQGHHSKCPCPIYTLDVTVIDFQCGGSYIDPLTCPLGDILEFQQSLLEAGRSESTLRGYEATTSA